MLDRVFKLRSKHRPDALNALVAIIVSESAVLESLSLAGNGLGVKGELNDLLDELGANDRIRRLDLSNNALGDHGAYILAKALQINRTLATLLCDGNGVTILGYAALVVALERNSTLKSIPTPINDYNACLKGARPPNTGSLGARAKMTHLKNTQKTQ